MTFGFKKFLVRGIRNECHCLKIIISFDPIVRNDENDVHSMVHRQADSGARRNALPSPRPAMGGKGGVKICQGPPGLRNAFTVGWGRDAKQV